VNDVDLGINWICIILENVDINHNTHEACFQRLFGIHKQGDQIGDIFTYWAIVYFENYTSMYLHT
jgi:hypothetical protein